MIELSAFTSIFEIFSLVYISATTIRQVLEDILRPVLSYYQREENEIIERYESYSSSTIAQEQLRSVFYHIYSYLISSTPNILARRQLDIAAYVSNETNRLVKKYRPLFFYSSLFCFVCLILSGLSIDIYFSFLVRFVITSYLLVAWHLFVTRNKSIDELNQIWICNNWIFNTIFLFIFSILNHIFFSILSLTNLINLYNYFVENILGSPFWLFLIASTFTIILLLFIMYIFYTAIIVPIRNLLKYAIIIIPIIEVIIRLPNILFTFNIKVNTYNLSNNRIIFLTLCILFIFLPITLLFLEHFLPSIWNKIKLKFLTNILNTIHRSNISTIENTGLSVSDNTIENVDRPTPIKLILVITAIIIFTVNFINWRYNDTSNQNELTENKIKALINQANQSEFNLYKNLPRVDTSLLKKHFIMDSPAYKQILKYAHSEKIKGRILCKQSSTFSLNSIKVMMEDSIIQVSTNETWSLEWYHPKEKDFIVKYDTTNTHTYWLERDNKTWKIKADIYNGKSKELKEKSICN